MAALARWCCKMATVAIRTRLPADPSSAAMVVVKRQRLARRMAEPRLLALALAMGGWFSGARRVGAPCKRGGQGFGVCLASGFPCLTQVLTWED